MFKGPVFVECINQQHMQNLTEQFKHAEMGWSFFIQFCNTRFNQTQCIYSWVVLCKRTDI